MISNRAVLSMALLFFSLSLVSHSVQSSYSSHYFSNWEVFRFIETKDERGFDAWMRTYPQVNIFNEYDQTPLMIAAQLQHYSFVIRLLNAGADKYCVDNFGKTARDYALIAERYYNASSLLSSPSSRFWESVDTGVAAGLCAYALCVLHHSADTTSIHTHYPVYGDHYYDYCTKCSSYVGYTTDPLQLYCTSCYQAYWKQQQAYNSYSSSSRMSDYL